VSLSFVFLFSATCRLAGKCSCLETSVPSHRQMDAWTILFALFFDGSVIVNVSRSVHATVQTVLKGSRLQIGLPINTDINIISN
jgi:hypothetical protein